MSIVKIYQIPDMNSLQPVKGVYFADSIKDYNVKTNYYQKVYKGQYIGLQVFLGGKYREAGTVGGLQRDPLFYTVLQLLDCEGNVVNSTPPSYTNQKPGNYSYNDGVPFLMLTVNWKTYMQNVATDNYQYRLALAYINEGALLYDYVYFEPIYVADSHPNTVLAEYLSGTDKLNVDYSSGGNTMFFHVLFEGDIWQDAPKADLTMYRDQDSSIKQQQAYPYRIHNLKLGYPGGMPMYMYDKINRIFSNDAIWLTNKGVRKRYTRADNAEIEIGNRVPRFNMYGGSLKLQEYSDTESNTTAQKLPLTLFTATKPYCLFSGFMSNSVSLQKVNYFNAFEVRTDAEEQRMVDIFGYYAVPTFNLMGRFEKSGNNIRYINGPYENFDTSTNTILTKYMDFTFTKIGTFLSAGFVIRAKQTSVRFYNNELIENIGDDTTYATRNITYNYGSSFGAIPRMYHKDTVTDIDISGGFPLTAFTGNVPTSIKNFTLQATQVTSVDFTNFPTSMTNIKVKDGVLTSVTGLNKAWAFNMQNFDFRNNRLSSSQVDAILNALYLGGASPLMSCTINLKGQTPAAPPTAASATARSVLTAAGNKIYTD